MRVPRLLLHALMAVGLLLTSLPLAAQSRQAKPNPIRILPPQPPEPLIKGGPEPDLEILFTSDVRGFYQPCG